MLVQEFLERAAARLPEKIALVDNQRRLSYRQLDTTANRLAHALRAGGVGRGDRVMIWLENSAEAVTAIFAALKADAIFIVIHPGTRPERLAFLLADAEPAALATDPGRAADAAEVIAAAPSLRCLALTDEPRELPINPTTVSAWADLDLYPAELPTRYNIDVDLATLIYTSGSTGQPKAVMSTHANMIAATTSINGYVRNGEDDVILAPLPLAFDYGLYQIMLAFQAGARVILERGFAYPAKVVGLMEREGVTGLPGVPTLFALLLKYPDLLKRPLPALRYLTNTAAALPTSHIEQIRAAFPGVTLYSMYGQTECKRISYLPPEELDRRPASVGIAIPNTEVWIVDDQGQRVPPGAVGELVVRGAHVMRGYWRAPELTAQRYRPGPLPGETVLYTGDLFRTDEEGFLYFIARRDDIIKTRGEKVSPREIENVVCQMPGVAEAAVVPVDDELLGQAIQLFVAPHPGVDLAERAIRAYCAAKLQDFMQPKYIDLIAEMPRTESGKVDKRVLREISMGMLIG